MWFLLSSSHQERFTSFGMLWQSYLVAGQAGIQRSSVTEIRHKQAHSEETSACHIVKSPTSEQLGMLSGRMLIKEGCGLKPSDQMDLGFCLILSMNLSTQAGMSRGGTAHSVCLWSLK